jgi:hypothetical protein
VGRYKWTNTGAQGDKFSSERGGFVDQLLGEFQMQSFWEFEVNFCSSKCIICDVLSVRFSGF